MFALIHRPNPPRVIDDRQLEDLYAEGLTTKEVAKRLNIYPTLLSRKIVNSSRLTAARARGKKRAKDNQLLRNGKNTDTI